ncbi:PQQ-like beta-propeller repeat protein [Streptomyces muensis]|uniref:PQQ-like beta-propeller repeat protein n=1 Tax=Streptomyces muensis TaxID=1077944 RepID=A0A9X1Q3V0_STRM4|nr:PQQ-like beta-propeller repeat protein [Streptomyces muensis]MCF1597419.1 PQQ-like beta-propeller repeat protein [Streptomyces muensis]
MAIRSRLLAPALALLLAIPLLAVAHQARPAPYGDHLTVPRTAPARVPHATPRLRTHGTALQAHDPRTGALRWRYAREGRRPLTSLHARGDVITLWDDGLVTATDGRTVRWHRALPAPGDWLPAHGGTGVLRPLGHGMLAVVTPRRVAAYRVADGDLRWVLPARDGCAFRPERAVHHSKTLVVAQPCPQAAWTAQLVALDDLGRIVPGRVRPRLEHPNPEKVLAQPR